MYPRSFLCGEAKIKQHTSSKKELYGIGEEPIWESRFTRFIFLLHPKNLSRWSGKDTRIGPGKSVKVRKF